MQGVWFLIPYILQTATKQLLMFGPQKRGSLLYSQSLKPKNITPQKLGGFQ